jgi:hypothetical protein
VHRANFILKRVLLHAAARTRLAEEAILHIKKHMLFGYFGGAELKGGGGGRGRGRGRGGGRGGGR